MTMRTKAEEKFRSAAMLLFYILQIIVLANVACFQISF